MNIISFSWDPKTVTITLRRPGVTSSSPCRNDGGGDQIRVGVVWGGTFSLLTLEVAASVKVTPGSKHSSSSLAFGHKTESKSVTMSYQLLLILALN